jgi:hypothetical protein
MAVIRRVVSVADLRWHERKHEVVNIRIIFRIADKDNDR